MTAPIIVGVDGSTPSLQALTWATREATLRKAPLRVVHAALRWAYDVPLVPQPGHWGPAEEAACEELLHRAAEQVRSHDPAPKVTTEILDGNAAEAIAAVAESAQLVVVGHRGLGGFAGLLLGSVSHDLAARSPCPVVIVNQPHTTRGSEIVVGVTGRPDQDPVLEFAFGEAALHRRPLRALHAWTHPASRAPGDMQPLVYDVEEVGDEEARLLAESLSGRRERFPDVPLIEQVVHKHPAKALIDASETAELVVVGARGRAMFLSSTVRALLHHARAPVAVHHTSHDHRS
ncbi:universal stress protein [Streptosporangium sp. NPDC049046]|uniref:universal stress protein n=1 Tax=unclassified Streptosporangium TaxID=2632669 RepID=UPI00343832DE